MLDDLRALVELSDAGSIVRASARLLRSPSAVTRKVQRLEALLGADLLDRTVKPPRFTSLGLRVLDEARDLLRRADDLRGLASDAVPPRGAFRLGMSQALADSGVA